MVRPRISVIIPAYNGERYIESAIESVLTQRDANFELIVVDDGSTDNTPNILQAYGDRISVFSQQNQGVAAARNRGIEAAIGELIALLDQDDIFLPNKLATQTACFDTYPDIGLVVSGWRLIDAKGNKISEIKPWHDLPVLDLETLLTKSPILPSAIMFRRQWWQKVGGFDSQFNGVDDAEFVWRLALKGCQAVWHSEVTVGYRQHSQTVSNQQAIQRAKTFVAAQDHFFAQSNLPHSVTQLKSCARYEGLTWIAWHLYHTHNYIQMAEYLNQSLSYKPYTKAITISDWIQRFIGYCTAYGYHLDVQSFRGLPEWQNLMKKIYPTRQPTVSVIIPVYNSERFIEQAVKSVLEQTYTDYEVIVIDDGSTDNTRQVLVPYLDSIQYIDQDNQGAAKARNRGCQLAQGEFLAFLDADDFFLPNKLAEQVAYLEENPTIDLVQSGWIIVNQTGEGLVDVTPWKNAPELNLEAWVLHKCVRPSALMIKKEWWEKVGGFDHRYPPTEDLDFVLRLGLMQCKAAWCKQVHAGYRQHDCNLMSGGEKVIKNTDILMNQFFNQPDIPPNIRQIQQKEHYQRWVWLAWRMYRDGYPQLMLDCLRKSLEYTPFSRTETLLHWIEAFGNISVEYGEKFHSEMLTQSPQWQQAMTDLWRQRSTDLSFNLVASQTRHIILINTDDPGIGGLAQYDHLILCQLAQKGYQVTAVRPHHSSPLVEQEKAKGIQQYWLDYSTGSDLARILRNTTDAEEIYAKLKPDFIIFSDGWPFSHFAAKQVAIQQNIPYMIALGLATPEHSQFTMGDGVPYIEGVRYQYSLARAVNTAAHEHLKILHQDFNLPKTQGNVIYYGRSERYFAPRNLSIRQKLRQEVGIPETGIICLTTARLAPIKGHRYQLEAIAQLKHTSIWENLYFVWAGTGKGSDHDLEPELKETVQKLGVSDQVKFLGQCWNIPDWLDASDIFVLTSLAEAAPSFAVMEAMAKGLPIIASAAGGIPEGLGDTGQLLPDPNINPEGTVKILVETLKDWVINPELRHQIGQASKQRAEQLFKEDRMLHETLEVIEQALVSQPSTHLAEFPDVKTRIYYLNQRLSYAAKVWQAWNAYQNGKADKMSLFLQEALSESPFKFPTETLLDWVNDFVRLSELKGHPLDSNALIQSPHWIKLIEQTLGIIH